MILANSIVDGFFGSNLDGQGIVVVQLVQFAGNTLAKKLDKRYTTT